MLDRGTLTILALMLGFFTLGRSALAEMTQEDQQQLRTARTTQLDVEQSISEADVDIEELVKRLLRDYCGIYAFNEQELTERVWESNTKIIEDLQRTISHPDENTVRRETVRDVTVISPETIVHEFVEDMEFRLHITAEGMSIRVGYGLGGNDSDYGVISSQQIGARLTGTLRWYRGDRLMLESTYEGVQIPSREFERELNVDSAYNKMIDDLYGVTPEDAITKVMKKEGSLLPVLLTMLQRAYGIDMLRKIVVNEQEEDYVREAAVIVLGQIQSRDAVEILVSSFSDRDDAVQRALERTLMQVRNPAALEPLIQVLDSSNEGVRSMAVAVFGEVDDPRARDLLVKALKDPSVKIREESANSLGKHKDKATAPALTGALQDENKLVRYKAAWALCQINDPVCMDGLIIASQDENPNIRLIALRGLQEIKMPESAESVAQRLSDKYVQIRLQAAEALYELRSPAAVEALQERIKKDEELKVKWKSIEALGQIEDESATDALLDTMNNYGMAMRERSIKALRQTPYHAEALIARLKAEDKETRNAAAFALGEIRDPKAVSGLIELLKDRECRWNASAALRKISKRDFGKDYDQWKKWWDENEATFEGPPVKLYNVK
ncbi:HEAT repeat domain-containing protein [Candidatus Sumerlaeota bacterium]|nr:HEAT repeat domain-containing protein [Candidatus Sumerlaeota bacterium]